MSPSRLYQIAILCLCGASLIACAPSNKSANETTKPTELIFSVAASTKDVIEELAAAYMKSHPNVVVKVNPGPSNRLAEQIIEGAPVDLFLCANAKIAEEVRAKKAGVLVATQLLTNRLVLVVPKDNPANVNEPADLLKPDVKHVALAGEKVPAGIYADQALTKLALLAKLSEQNKIARGQDVRNTLSFVEQGEAEAGIVYASDVIRQTKIKTVYEFDSHLHDEIIYPLIAFSELHPRESVEFFEFLISDKFKEVYQRHGFIRVKAPTQNLPR